MTDGSLHQDVGHLEGKLDSLEKSVEKLTGRVEILTSVLDQGKGARWAAMGLLGLGAAAIAFLTSLATFFGMRMTSGGN